MSCLFHMEDISNVFQFFALLNIVMIIIMLTFNCGKINKCNIYYFMLTVMTKFCI